jgi:hypothetical protein
MIAAGEAAIPTLPAIAAPALPASTASASNTNTLAANLSPEYTRGLGIYPGDPRDVFAPTLLPDASTYRNLALRRPATHSSSYDYNLTAQLITDGIIDTHLPLWVAVSTSTDGPLPKPDREIILDHFPPIGLKLEAPQVSLEVQIAGATPPPIDRLRVFVTLPSYIASKDLRFAIAVSDDGRTWENVGAVTAPTAVSPENFPPDLTHGTSLYYPFIPLARVCQNRFYRLTCDRPNHPTDAQSLPWTINQVEFYHTSNRVQIGGPYNFTSAWMSAGSAEEWVAVDLGARCTFDRIALHWIARAAEGTIQISDDAEHWTALHTLTPTTNQLDDIRLPQPAHARHIRVLMTRPTAPHGYILSELEVYGRGGPIPHPAPATQPDANNTLALSGGAWRVERASQIDTPGAPLSLPNFNDATWLPATVPGTILTSFYNAGALPDPNFGDNQLFISDAYFCSDFWYRTEFDMPQTTPPTTPNQIAWLNFDGINWKAEIFLNGEPLGHIDGGFIRGRFDVTTKLRPTRNALAVLIRKNDTPGSTKQKTFENPSRNGGALGADNPTYHASIGWDWIPTIRGRNTGIWGNVSLTHTGAVTLEAPFVSSTLPLPSTSTADITIEVSLVNHHPAPTTGTLRARFGTIEITQALTLRGSSSTTAKLTPTQHPELHLTNPQLWWPNGYGDPHLYDVELTFATEDHTIHDTKSFKHGIRQMTYSEAGGKLAIFINGRRFICRGGNWGFGESMLRYRAREYDAALRYHREMNFTMVRNWVGQIGDDAFFAACDRHGIMVWQDFWLANPWDGPIPNDDAMFMANARDLLLRIRNHASIGLYCGRNEGYPPQPLERDLRDALAHLHPNLHYIPSSADDVVSGHGPYHALPPTDYFRIADTKLHSELGMPNIPPIESLRLMMPEKSLWPQALDWGLHDFCLLGAQGGKSFRTIIEESYGGADNADQWISLAQFLNFEGYRAIFESQSTYRAGLLLWMSHPCWPSLVWQTYDYFFEPTAAYFACKKASEPLHIQWNRLAETIEVVNYSAGNHTALTATADIFNLDGKQLAHHTTTLDSKEDSTVTALTMQYPQGLSPVHLLRLTLTQGNTTLSTNDYLRSTIEGDFRAIRQLPKAHIKSTTTAHREADLWHLTTELENTSAWPSLMTRIKAVRSITNDRILPAIYSDNYITLMPGERRTLHTELQHTDTRGETPKVVLTGFNVA